MDRILPFQEKKNRREGVVKTEVWRGGHLKDESTPDAVGG